MEENGLHWNIHKYDSLNLISNVRASRKNRLDRRWESTTFAEISLCPELSCQWGTVYLVPCPPHTHPNPPSCSPPACGISRTPHLCFSPSVRTTLKCCFRYPWVSPIKAAPSPRRYCFLRMIDWWMRADTSMKPFPLASLSDDVQRIFSIHASLLACVIPGTSFTPCSLKDLF